MPPLRTAAVFLLRTATSDLVVHHVFRRGCAAVAALERAVLAALDERAALPELLGAVAASPAATDPSWTVAADGLGVFALQGSALTLLVAATAKSQRVRARGRRLLRILESQVKDPMRSAAFAESRSFSEYARTYLLLEFSETEILGHFRFDLPARASGAPADGLEEEPVRERPIDRLSDLAAQLKQMAIWPRSHFWPKDPQSMDLGAFVACLVSDRERLHLGQPSLWDGTIADVAICIRRFHRLHDLVSLVRYCHNMGILRVYRETLPTSFVVPTLEGLARQGNDDLAVLVPHLDPIDTLASVQKRIERRLPGHRFVIDISELLESVTRLVDAGLLMQLQILPRINWDLFSRDTALSGLTPVSIKRLQSLAQFRDLDCSLDELTTFYNAHESPEIPLTVTELADDLAFLDSSVRWYSRDEDDTLRPERLAMAGRDLAGCVLV